MPPKKDPNSSNNQEDVSDTGEGWAADHEETGSTSTRRQDHTKDVDGEKKLENGNEDDDGEGSEEDDVVVEGEEEETEESDDEDEEESDEEEEEEEEDGEDDDNTKDKTRSAKKRKVKRVLLNVYISNESEDALSEPDLLKVMMSDNEVEIKEIKTNQEQNWILYGRIELEKSEDRDKAIALTGKSVEGKEIKVERIKDTMSDRLYAPDDCILFVRNLPKTITEVELRKLFPTSKDVRLPKKNGKSRGFAFLNFATRKEVEDLIKDRQSEDVDGKAIKLGTYTSRDRSDNRRRHTIKDVSQNNVLFIGNLNYDTKEETVKKFFKSAISVRILRFLKRKSGKSKGVGFIEFKSPEAAKNAYEQKNGVTIDDREIFLEFAESEKAASAGIGKPKKSPQVTNKNQSQSGKESKHTPNRQVQGYRQGYSSGYGGTRYPASQIRSLLDVDPYGYSTARYQGNQLRSLLDYDDYGYYKGDYGFDSYMYDLQSRMGLESGLSSRMGLGRGQSGRLALDNRNYNMGGMSSMDMGYGGNRTSFGRGFGGIDRSRLGLESGGGNFVGYGLGNQGGYNDGGSNIFRNMDKKRYRSGPSGNRSTKGKSGWPAK